MLQLPFVLESPAVNDLAAALAKAQGQIKAAAKDATNPHFGKTYADLASVWEACREPLSTNGLAVLQSVVPTEEYGTLLVTTLVHSTGQFQRSFYPLKPTKDDPQGWGSCITYARRYSLSSIVGVAPDDDDDGNAANGKGAQDGGRQAERPPHQSNGPKAGPKGKPAANAPAGPFVFPGGKFKGKAIDKVTPQELFDYMGELRAAKQTDAVKNLQGVIQKHLDALAAKEAAVAQPGDFANSASTVAGAQ